MNGAKEESTSVSELSHFPFPNFDEFRKHSLSGVASLGVDRGVAVQWAMKGIFAPAKVRAKVTLLSWVPYFIVIAFIAYVIMKAPLWWLLALPLFVFWYMFSNPGMAYMLGMIHKGVMALVWGGLVWGLANSMPALAAFTAALLGVRYATSMTYKISVEELINAASEKEELLCKLWNGNAININLYNGDTYSLKYCTVAGNSTWHE